eukprot:scaffold468_cov127-Cylindrotheca_fusiformis.AAC.1
MSQKEKALEIGNPTDSLVRDALGGSRRRNSGDDALTMAVGCRRHLLVKADGRTVVWGTLQSGTESGKICFSNQAQMNILKFV